jgi:hypothetical protein
MKVWELWRRKKYGGGVIIYVEEIRMRWNYNY